MALLSHQPRVATVTAASTTEAIEIDSAVFRKLLDGDPGLRRRVEDESERRVSDRDLMQRTAEAGDLITFLVREGMGEGTDVLLIEESLCVRCDNCEKACAETHHGISRLNREAGPTFAMVHVPTSCRHCEDPHCMTDCPPDAIHRAANGEVFINDQCIGCGNCGDLRCPYGVAAPDGCDAGGEAEPVELALFRAGPGPGEGRVGKRHEAPPRLGARRQMRHVQGPRRTGLRARLPDRRGDPGQPGDLYRGDAERAMSMSDSAYATARSRLSRHVSFLAYDNFRYLKIALAAVFAAIVLYVAVPPYGERYGGGWAGYTLGTVGALLIVWLTWFGYRKRTYDPDRKYVHPHDAGATDVAHQAEDPSRLARRLSAHVYLGVALVVIATLHTGFHFGWNIHTLAYVLMCLVIASGIYGVFAYLRYPRQMTQNRESMTLAQLQARDHTADRSRMRRRADAGGRRDGFEHPRLARKHADRRFDVARQVSGRYPDCGTAAAIARLHSQPDGGPGASDDTWRLLRAKLDEKESLVVRLRRDIRFKALMDIWLYLHVPLTFALLAALIAHIVSVFYL